MKILLLRHGETEWNLTDRMQGLSDTRLTAAGVAQAVEAVKAMPRFGQIWSGPLKRAFATAETVATAHGVEFLVDERLTERSWGEWEGLLPDEVDLRWPGWRAAGRKPAGYEHDDSVIRRFRAWLAEVSEVPGPVLVVTHGGFMAAIVRTLGGAGSGFKNLEGVWISAVSATLVLLRHEEFIPDARRLTR